MLKKTFFNYKIKIKTTTIAGLKKNELKYSPRNVRGLATYVANYSRAKPRGINP